MTETGETGGRSALGLLYGLAVAVCAICIGLFLWSFGVAMIVDVPEAGPMIRGALMTLLIPLGPGTFALIGAIALKFLDRTPSRFFRIAVILCAIWTAGMTFMNLGA